MAIAEPKTKKIELINRISELSGAIRKTEESEINALKEELGNLKNKQVVFAAEYHHLLSNIAGLEGDTRALITHYKKSLSFAREEKDFKYDYAAALLNRGLLSQAQIQWEQLIASHPNDITIIDGIIKNYYLECHFQDVLQFANEKINEVSIQTDTRLALIIKTSKECDEILKNTHLSEEKAVQLCKLAFSLIEKNNLYLSACNIRTVDNCIHYVIYVDKPIKEIFDLNWALAELFAELENAYSDALLFEYSSVEIWEEKYT